LASHDSVHSLTLKLTDDFIKGLDVDRAYRFHWFVSLPLEDVDRCVAVFVWKHPEWDNYSAEAKTNAESIVCSTECLEGLKDALASEGAVDKTVDSKVLYRREQ